MASRLLVVHERIGYWGGQLRSRLADRPVRVVVSRSTDDLQAALAGSVCPLVVIDLGQRTRAGLDDLDRALEAAPDALALVLDPEPVEGVALLARELGATHVLSGPVTPPAVASLLSRWLAVAQSRAEASGWAGTPPEPPQPEPWNWLDPQIRAWSGGPRAAGE